MIGNRRHLVVGLITLVAIAAFAAFVGLTLSGGIGRNTYQVTAEFDKAGQLLKVTSDVKLRGILVGKVDNITRTEEGTALITMAMFKSQRVPENVTAAVRGKTLFGEKFIQLSVDKPSKASLKEGDKIAQDKTTNPFELEQVLQTGLPVLNAIEPEELAKTFHALAEGLSGQEEAAKRAIDNGLIALQSLNSEQAALDRTFGGLDESADALARAAPDLVAALESFNAFNQVVIENRSEASGALRDVPSWMDQLAQIMEIRFNDLVDISVKGADILDVVSARRQILPSTITSLKNFTQAWATNMSVGCRKADGTEIGTAHPELAGSTCWQIWNLTAESSRDAEAYNDATRPSPDSASAARAFRAQVTHLQALPFGTEPAPVSLLIYSPLKDERGLIPEKFL